MREIIFKGKELRGSWVEGSLYKDCENNCYILNKATLWYTKSDGEPMRSVYQSSATKVDPETVCQLTGVIDKNGKKIFEGDIAKLKHCTAHYTCTWAPEAACFYWQCNVTNDYSNMHHEAEIIGNIHDKKDDSNGN